MGFGSASTVSNTLSIDEQDTVFQDVLANFATTHEATQSAMNKLTETNSDLQHQLHFVTY